MMAKKVNEWEPEDVASFSFQLEKLLLERPRISSGSTSVHNPRHTNYVYLLKVAGA